MGETMKYTRTVEASARCIDCGDEWSSVAAAGHAARHAGASGHSVESRVTIETTTGPAAAPLLEEAERLRGERTSFQAMRARERRAKLRERAQRRLEEHDKWLRDSERRGHQGQQLHGLVIEARELVARRIAELDEMDRTGSLETRTIKWAVGDDQ